MREVGPEESVLICDACANCTAQFGERLIRSQHPRQVERVSRLSQLKSCARPHPVFGIRKDVQNIAESEAIIPCATERFRSGSASRNLVPRAGSEVDPTIADEAN